MSSLPATQTCTEIGWELLPKVSRSFALVTRSLKDRPGSELGDAVMVFYLVCRVLDTIEDSDLDAAEKRPLYGAFLGMLEAGPAVELLGRLSPSHAGYRDLLASLDAVAGAVRGLDVRSREIVLRRAREMAEGMDAFGSRRIVTLEDLDAYCHPVAVVVGHGLTELFAAHGHIPEPDARAFELSRHFGLCLQKVNVTRDFGQDHAAGRAYWPEALLAAHGLTAERAASGTAPEAALAALAAMVGSIRADARGGIGYTLAIPPAEHHLRMFCGVSLLLALRTLAVVRGNAEVFVPSRSDHPRRTLKVPRAQVAELVTALSEVAGDDARLGAMLEEAFRDVFSPAS